MVVQVTLVMTLPMTSAHFVTTAVNVTTNSPSQDYTHPDDHTSLTYDITPVFKLYTNTTMST